LASFIQGGLGSSVLKGMQQTLLTDKLCFPVVWPRKLGSRSLGFKVKLGS
jgi:hypothetical protein